MSSAPVIGVTTGRIPTQTPLPYVGANEAYLRAVRRAGGLPLLLPVGNQPDELDALLSRLDGLLFTGGGDIDPAFFNGLSNPKIYDIDRPRDEQEIALIRRAAESGLPFLGICRGTQVFNVALGGTLYTDIADQKPGALKHDWFPGHPREYLAHPVQAQPGSLLSRLLGSQAAQVNSLHHQGIDQLSPSLQATAYAPDGMVEAVELPGHPFALGVQWHPEWLPDDPAMRGLFAGLIQAAKASPQSNKGS